MKRFALVLVALVAVAALGFGAGWLGGRKAAETATTTTRPVTTAPPLTDAQMVWCGAHPEKMWQAAGPLFTGVPPYVDPQDRQWDVRWQQFLRWAESQPQPDDLIVRICAAAYEGLRE